MRNDWISRAVTAMLLISSAPLAAAASIHWTYPAIAHYGPVRPLPDAAVQPQGGRTYKAVFDVTKPIKAPSRVDAGLDHVARAVNVFAAAHVPPSHLHFVAVLHGPATRAVLDNAHYRRLYGRDNPNLPLLKALRKAGVDVEVCGQALADNHFRRGWVAPSVRVTLSALSDLIIYQNEGYAFVKQ